MPTLELNTQYQDARRFPGWVSLAVFSVVAVAGITSRNKAEKNMNFRQADEKWALAVGAVSFLLAFVSVGCYLTCRSLFMGQIFEAAMCALTLGFWGAGLPVIMNPNNDIAVFELTVVNANLYFASWICFSCTLFLTFSLVQEVLGVDWRSLTPEKAPRWFGLTASSLVVMGSSIRVFKSVGCNTADHIINHSRFCKRTKFAMAVGIIGFFFAGGITILISNGVYDLMLELGVATILFVLWCFGVGYITFGAAPGSEIGNLYFSTWISFVLIVLLFGSAIKELVGGGPAQQAQPTDQGPGVDANGGQHGDYGESYGDSGYDQGHNNSTTTSPQRHTTPVIPSEEDI